MTKEQILEYIMKTPSNTNVNVLSGMLDSLVADSTPEEEEKTVENNTTTNETPTDPPVDDTEK